LVTVEFAAVNNVRNNSASCCVRTGRARFGVGG